MSTAFTTTAAEAAAAAAVDCQPIQEKKNDNCQFLTHYSRFIYPLPFYYVRVLLIVTLVVNQVL